MDNHCFVIPGVLKGVVGTADDLNLKGAIFVTIMSVVSGHFGWLQVRLNCARRVLARDFELLLNKLACTCEDCSLNKPMAA